MLRVLVLGIFKFRVFCVIIVYSSDIVVAIFGRNRLEVRVFGDGKIDWEVLEKIVIF